MVVVVKVPMMMMMMMMMMMPMMMPMMTAAAAAAVATPPPPTTTTRISFLIGAFGYFEVMNDITRYTKSTVFETIGKRTPIAVRFSTVGGESGSADTVR